jgi:hypothetical protein
MGILMTGEHEQTLPRKYELVQEISMSGVASCILGCHENDASIVDTNEYRHHILQR